MVVFIFKKQKHKNEERWYHLYHHFFFVFNVHAKKFFANADDQIFMVRRIV
jgi:hypothetical protein